MKLKLFLLASVVALFAIGVMFSNGQQKQEKPEAKVIDFTLKSLDGKDIKLSNVSKGKVLLLKFGTTWCGWCTKAIPELNKVVETYKDKVAVIEVNVKEPKDKVVKHFKEHKVSYPVLLDTNGAIAAKYKVKGYPYIILANDKTVIPIGGYLPFEELKKGIDSLLPKEEKKDAKKPEEKKPADSKKPEAKK